MTDNFQFSTFVSPLVGRVSHLMHRLTGLHFWAFVPAAGCRIPFSVMSRILQSRVLKMHATMKTNSTRTAAIRGTRYGRHVTLLFAAICPRDPLCCMLWWCCCSWQLAPECGSSLLLRSARMRSRKCKVPIYSHIYLALELGEIPGINKNT